MKDDELFQWGEAYARSSDPDTSHAAANDVEGDEATRLELLFRDAVWSRPNGATNHDICTITGLDWNTITPRARPLVRKGLIADSGERRIGPKGKKCIVWIKPPTL